MNTNSAKKYLLVRDGIDIYSAGIDVVELDRIFKINKKNPAVFNRLLNGSETQAVESCNRESAKVEWTARFFAMKEAVMKSCGIGWQEGVSWQDIGLEKKVFTQSPDIRGELKRKIEEKINSIIVVSAKHEKMVVAYAVSLKK